MDNILVPLSIFNVMCIGIASFVVANFDPPVKATLKVTPSVLSDLFVPISVVPPRRESNGVINRLDGVKSYHVVQVVDRTRDTSMKGFAGTKTRKESSMSAPAFMHAHPYVPAKSVKKTKQLEPSKVPHQGTPRIPKSAHEHVTTSMNMFGHMPNADASATHNTDFNIDPLDEMLNPKTNHGQDMSMPLSMFGSRV